MWQLVATPRQRPPLYNEGPQEDAVNCTSMQSTANTEGSKWSQCAVCFKPSCAETHLGLSARVATIVFRNVRFSGNESTAFPSFCCPQNNTPKRACAAWMHPGMAPPGGVYEGAQLPPVAIRMALGGPEAVASSMFRLFLQQVGKIGF